MPVNENTPLPEDRLGVSKAAGAEHPSVDGVTEAVVRHLEDLMWTQLQGDGGEASFAEEAGIELPVGVAGQLRNFQRHEGRDGKSTRTGY